MNTVENQPKSKYFEKRPKTLAAVYVVTFLVTMTSGILIGFFALPKKEVKIFSESLHADVHLHVPRKIWAFWNEETVEPVNYTAQPHLGYVEGWRRLNPDHKVTLITPLTMANYISSPKPKNFEKLGPAHQCDWIRASVLNEHGGIWIDCSTILTANLSFIHNMQRSQNAEGFMFYLKWYTLDMNYPVFENGFIATIAGGQLIKALLKEFTYAIEEHALGQSYHDELRKKYGDDMYDRLAQRIPNDMRTYLTMHIALQKIMQIDGVSPVAGAASEYWPFGPYQHMVSLKWDADKVVESLIKPWSANQYLPPLFKINGNIRSKLNEALTESNFHQDSVFNRYVLQK